MLNNAIDIKPLWLSPLRQKKSIKSLLLGTSAKSLHIKNKSHHKKTKSRKHAFVQIWQKRCINLSTYLSFVESKNFYEKQITGCKWQNKNAGTPFATKIIFSLEKRAFS